MDAARPHQWVKNLLLFAASATGGVLFQPSTFCRALLGLFAFCAAASATYLINDSVDVESDRRHPVKRLRPIAAGRLSVFRARRAAVVLLVGAFALAVPLGATFTGLVGVYLALTFSYSFWLKRVPVVDIIAVAAGFLLRALAGGAATGVPLSRWFLLVTSFGALFLVTGKRHSEVSRFGASAGEHHASLAAYTPAFTQQILTMALSGAVISYCLWALQFDSTNPRFPWLPLSIAPFLIMSLRASMLISEGRGEDPQRMMARDRVSQVAACALAGMLGVGIYLA